MSDAPSRHRPSTQVLTEFVYQRDPSTNPSKELIEWLESGTFEEDITHAFPLVFPPSTQQLFLSCCQGRRWSVPELTLFARQHPELIVLPLDARGGLYLHAWWRMLDDLGLGVVEKKGGYAGVGDAGPRGKLASVDAEQVKLFAGELTWEEVRSPLLSRVAV